MDSEQKSIFQDDGIDLKELWFSFYNFKELIIAVSILFGILAYIYSLSITPTYQASALVVPADQDQNATNAGGGLGGLAALAGIQIENTDPVRTQIAIFKSRKFIEKFIEEENLLPMLFREYWDEENKVWTEEPAPTPAEGYGRYYKSLSMKPDADLHIILFEMKDPYDAAELTNKSIERLNNYSRNKAIKEAEKSIVFLEEEISKTNIANAQKFLFSLIEQQTKNKMLASVRDEYVFEVIDPATVPTGIYRPNRNQIAFLGLFIGFFVSYVLGLFTHVFGISIPMYSDYRNSYLIRVINKIKPR